MNPTDEFRHPAASPLRVGDALPSLGLTVTAEKMKTAAALLADPNPIHFDSTAVEALGLGDRTINQGPLNMGYIMNMLATFSGSHDRLRNFKVRFLSNVFAGDQVRATGRVSALRTAPDNGELAVDCDVELAVVGAEPVLSGTATVVVPLTKYYAAAQIEQQKGREL